MKIICFSFSLFFLAIFQLSCTNGPMNLIFPNTGVVGQVYIDMDAFTFPYHHITTIEIAKSDSSVFAYTNSDTSGHYSTFLPEGNYILSVKNYNAFSGPYIVSNGNYTKTEVTIPTMTVKIYKKNIPLKNQSY